jgi:putative heme transporter
VPDPDRDAPASDAGQATPGRLLPVRVVDLDPRSVLVAVATVIGILALVSMALSGPVTALIVVAALLAFALDPVVDVIEHRLKMRRGYAVATLVLAVVLVTAGTLAVLGGQTVEQARGFQEDLPGVVEELDNLPLVGPYLAENDVPQKIQDWAAQLPRQLSGDTSQISNAAETVTTALLGAMGMALIMIALLIDGPWLVASAQRLIPPERRDTADRMGRIVGRVIGRYFAGSLLLSVLQGLQVLVTGLVLGVPLSPLLAVWAAVWNLVPQLGGAIGGIVFVLVAFTQGATTGIIAGVIYMVYLTFANNVLLPVILGKAVDISPLTTMVATIAGFSIGGIIGAMLAVPIIGAGKAMYLEVRSHRRADVYRDPEPPPGAPGPVRRIYERIRQRGTGDGPTPAAA